MFRPLKMVLYVKYVFLLKYETHKPIDGTAYKRAQHCLDKHKLGAAQIGNKWIPSRNIISIHILSGNPNA